jgi:hypothetical protein
MSIPFISSSRDIATSVLSFKYSGVKFAARYLKNSDHFVTTTVISSGCRTKTITRGLLKGGVGAKAWG